MSSVGLRRDPGDLAGELGRQRRVGHQQSGVPGEISHRAGTPPAARTPSDGRRQRQHGEEAILVRDRYAVLARQGRAAVVQASPTPARSASRRLTPHRVRRGHSQQMVARHEPHAARAGSRAGDDEIGELGQLVGRGRGRQPVGQAHACSPAGSRWCRTRSGLPGRQHRRRAGSTASATTVSATKCAHRLSLEQPPGDRQGNGVHDSDRRREQARTAGSG